MSWHTATRQDLIYLKEFLIREELTCVAFSSRIREYFNSLFLGSEIYAILINKHDQAGRPKITEAILLTQKGLIVPVLSKDIPFSLHHDKNISVLFHRYRQKLNSIMGTFDSVQKTGELFEDIPYAQVDYYLMTQKLKGFPLNKLPSLPGITTRMALPEDAGRLFELQKNYELEEVFLDPSHFDERRCRSMLRKNLKKQLVFIAEQRGIPVAKAGTNARGYNVDQIGGVYTREDMRNRGIASLLMQVLLDAVGQTKEQVCLFVKKNNPSALNLYNKLHFTRSENYRISYYSS